MWLFVVLPEGPGGGSGPTYPPPGGPPRRGGGFGGPFLRIHFGVQFFFSVGHPLGPTPGGGGHGRDQPTPWVMKLKEISDPTCSRRTSCAPRNPSNHGQTVSFLFPFPSLENLQKKRDVQSTLEVFPIHELKK